MRKASVQDFAKLAERVGTKGAHGQRRCEHPGCAQGGEFRAPRSRDDLNSFYWFCLDHVRLYNQAWNYYAGMDPAEIEAQIRFDTVWQRPTWPLGGRGAPRFSGGAYTDPAEHLRDGFAFFADEATDPPRDGMTPRHRSPEHKALHTLGLAPPITKIALKKRYKELAKRFHPDRNNGDKAAEEQLKEINEAYTILKNWVTA